MTTISSQPESRSPQAVRRLGPVDVLVLAAWCGLAAGELEVVARVVSRALSSTHRLYLITRHFVWLVPLLNMVLFLALGTLLALATRLWPRRAGWLCPRLLIVLAIFPVLMVAGRSIYLEAWLLVALGIALRMAPVLERHPVAARRWLVRSVPVVLGLVLLQAGWIFGGDRVKEWREAGRPLPAAGSPNVLLIVLDTVRADHLSLYGYPRPTTPKLERLARRGVRFDQARAAAPWTLASHANMFTGRWPHELGIEWTCPLREDVPTLAEYLGSLGYATAGFAANTYYCSYDSGLDRGFVHYQDYALNKLNGARTVKLVSELLQNMSKVGRFLPIAPMTALKLSQGERKGAHVVNAEFLNWLSRRRQPQRPFFAFLNYVDAHSPYLLPPGTSSPLGSAPLTDSEMRLLAFGWNEADKRRIPVPGRLVAIDAYDNCVAYLDRRLGELIDDLERRGELENTLVIVTADHGEGLGEHGLFDHGESLYRTEVRVPLLFLLPGERRAAASTVAEVVSLRDIATTVADFIRPGTKSPFPGRSLLTLAQGGVTPAATAARTDHDGVVLSELASPNPSDPNQGRSPGHRGALFALAEGEFVYIRNQGNGHEELFNQHEDPHELVNRAGAEVMQPVLERFRHYFGQVNAPTPGVSDERAAPRVASTPSP
jgi:arylsulfatase A-like enzyme